jgi:hypothetical protein
MDRVRGKGTHLKNIIGMFVLYFDVTSPRQTVQGNVTTCYSYRLYTDIHTYIIYIYIYINYLIQIFYYTLEKNR